MIDNTSLEIGFVETARRLYPWFPVGELQIGTNPPDVVLFSRGETIAVKVTRLFHPATPRSKYPRQQVAQFHQDVATRAQEIAKAEGLPVYKVLVYFWNDEPLSNLESAARALVEFVRTHPVESRQYWGRFARHDLRRRAAQRLHRSETFFVSKEPVTRVVCWPSLEGKQEQNTMSQSPDAVAREWFEQLWNQKKLDTIDRLFAPDGIAHGLTGDAMKGPEGFRAFYSAFSEAFPDIHIEVLRTVVEGEFVVTHNRVTGSHAGHTLGFPATGRNTTFEGVSIIRVVDGKIAEAWNFYDFLSMYQQLGVTPPMMGV